MPETNFFWDPLSDNILQERDAIGALTAEYTTERGLYGNVISQNRSGIESQFHFDAVGSTMVLTDGAQQVTDARSNTAFGETTESTGPTAFPFQYVGQKGYYRDGVTGQYLVRARRLAPQLARWCSIDPARLRRDTNAYLYVANSPTVAIDPSGLAWSVTIGGIDFKSHCDASYQVNYDFFIPTRDIPRDPIPSQIWILNSVRVSTLDSNCNWEQQTFRSLHIGPDGKVTTLPARKEKWLVDVYSIWKLRSNRSGAHVDDTNTSIALGPSTKCLSIMQTDKVIGFNSLRDGANFELPLGGSINVDILTKEQQEQLLNMRGPLGQISELHVLFNKANCGQCLTQCIPSLLWDLVPSCIECVTFNVPNFEEIPRDGTRPLEEAVPVLRAPYVCRPKGEFPRLIANIPF